MIRVLLAAGALALTQTILAQPALAQDRSQLDAMIARHAAANGVPESLVHRVVLRESRYNPRAVGRGGAMGLMQIKAATARGVGYSGGAAGLLDADTNLTYAVRYLAGAYRAAGGNHSRAVSLYASGYYYHAKRQGQTVAALARAPRTAMAQARIAADAPDAPAEPVADDNDTPAAPLSSVSPADGEFPH